jgi:transcriptional regulator with XRE-family HTH domain
LYFSSFSRILFGGKTPLLYPKKCKSERPILKSRFCTLYGIYAWMPLKFTVPLLIVLRDEQKMHRQRSSWSIMSFEEIVPNERLRRARDLRGWTQADLAEALGTDFETVSRWERGITVPSSHYREKLCSVLDKTAEELGLRSEGLDLLATSTCSYVFLASSFADAELEFVTRLKADLQTREITILSSRAVKRHGGANINKALQEAVRAAQVVLVVGSPAARSSRHVQEALQLAKIYQRPISVVWIAGESWRVCMPKGSDTPYATIDGRKGYGPSLLNEIVAMLERAQLAPDMPTPSFATYHAEATYAALPSEEHRRLARTLFVRLINPGVTDQDTTCRRAALAEFMLDDPTRTRLLRETIDTFMAARLLTTDTRAGFATVEVSHEALIREWPRLSDWLHVAREDIHLQQMISEDTAEWEQHGEPTDRLYRGSQLKEAQAWARRNFPSKKEAIFLRTGAVQRLRSLLTAMLVALLLLSTTSVAGWTVLHQPQPPDPTHVTTLADSVPGSLRWAIENAPAGSTITFAPRLRGTILLIGGDLQFVKNLTLRGPGADVLAISGGERGYIVHVTHDASVSITGLAFKDSKFKGNSPSFITNEGKLTLSKSMVSNNWLYSDSRLASEKGGGGIYNAGALSLIDSTVSNNESGNVGGGIYNAGTLSLIDSTVSGNMAQSDGGGIFNNSSDPSGGVSLTNSTVSGNTAQGGSGGGIENDSGALILTNSTVSGNTARGDGGGGIYSLGMLMLTNTTVANNIAQSSGGGIYKAGNQAELTFCTIYGNKATRGGGIAIVMGAAKNGKQTIPGFIKITNSIVAANSSAMSPDISGPIITGGYNLIQNLVGATVVPDHKHSTDLPGMTFAELRIDSSLRENRGYTQTLALLRGSPVRDRIPLNACSVDGISTDQRGVQRPDDDETACDIGAYESTD